MAALTGHVSVNHCQCCIVKYTHDDDDSDHCWECVRCLLANDKLLAGIDPFTPCFVRNSHGG